MITDFFEEDKPCPMEIPNCAALRAEYKKELSSINPKSCQPCVLNSLKSKYLTIISTANK